MNTVATFQEILSRLADQNQPFPAKYLRYFSDLSEEQVELFKETWKGLTSIKKISILEDLEDLGEHDTLMDFMTIGEVGLEEEDENIRETALHLLWECDNKSIIRAVIKLLATDPSERVRASAASLMGRYVYMGETDDLSGDLTDLVTDTLLKAHKNDSDKLVRRHALESLGYSSREEVPDLIKQAINKNDSDWLASGLYAMGRSADSSWSKIIEKYFTHSEDKVREEAIRAAGELELSHTRETLLDILENDESDDILAATIWSLSQIGGEGVRGAITKLALNIQDEELLEFIEEALENLDFTEELSRFDLFELDNDGSED
jgi:HEAT repeat protein